METLFGIPVNQLMVVLLGIFGIGVAIMTIVALRNRAMFKLGVRNIARRRSQTTLIVLGLMLATVLFSAALTTGDTLTHSVRVLALKQLGQTDVGILAEHQEAYGRPAYFEESLFETIQQALADDPEVEGVAPLVYEYAPVVAPTNRLSEHGVAVLGLAEGWMSAFDRLEDGDANTLSVAALVPGQVYVSRGLASELEVETGDTIHLYLGTAPTELQIAGVYERGGSPAGKLSAVVPLAQLQSLTGHEGEITQVLVNNRGDALRGAEHSAAVLSALEPVLQDTGLVAEPWKQDALDSAESEGNSASTVFFVFAQFSVAAGVMLIFLLFVMLAAERKRELGITRAVGTQRGHLIQMFTFEGAMYALVAAAIGSLLGVAIGLAMVRILGVAFGQVDLELVFAFNWRSVIISYTLGIALTYAVVLVSSWRVSRLNIVRAIRDIPEPSERRRTWKGLILSIALPLFGLLLANQGYDAGQATVYNLGVSLIIIGVPLVARRLRVSDRLAFSAAGIGLVVWWLLPSDVLGLPEMEQGIEIFFVSGIMLVIGAVWTVMYNSDLMVSALLRLMVPVRGLAPVIKTALTYPMQNRLRTGITLAMFSLIVFTLVMMGFIIEANVSIWEDSERLSGGYHVRAHANLINPVPDIRAALVEHGDINVDDFDAIASFAGASVRVKQEGSGREWVDWWIRGHDDGYADSVTHGFALTADGYDSPREVWRALQEQPGTAVVDSWLVPAKTNFNVGDSVPDFQLDGLYLEDDTLPDVTILVQDPRTGAEQRLRVIGVVNSGAAYTGGVMVSQETLQSLVSVPIMPDSYFFRLKAGVDAGTMAKTLEAGFLEHGMQGVVIEEEIREDARVGVLINTLLEGFMGLGLVVGIAALGVIAARSVVERRQQIGILRALGFQKNMVQLSFLLESSFVALLGIAIGVVLGTTLSYRVINELKEDIAGLSYRVPWLNLVIVVFIAYGASLLTTILPARKAAQIYPAEALRFE